MPGIGIAPPGAVRIYQYRVSTVAVGGMLSLSLRAQLVVWLCDPLRGDTPRGAQPRWPNALHMQRDPQPCGAEAPFENKALPAALALAS